MKIRQIIAVAVIVLLGTSFAQAAAARLSVNPGDTAYVCQCDSKCGCETASLKPAKGSCGHELVKVTVTRVKGKQAYYQAEGKERAFKLTGKYGCACGSDCCMTISQKPGKCCCGKEMVKGGKSV